MGLGTGTPARPGPWAGPSLARSSPVGEPRRGAHGAGAASGPRAGCVGQGLPAGGPCPLKGTVTFRVARGRVISQESPALRY